MLSLVQLWLAEAADTAAAAAEATEPGGATRSGSGAGGAISQFVLIGGFILILYFLFMGPQRKKEKQRKQMIAALQKGDRVMTIGGMYGEVWQVKDDEVIIEVDNDVKLTFTRAAIASVDKKGDGLK